MEQLHLEISKFFKYVARSEEATPAGGAFVLGTTAE
jgi:hypothetical protein